MEICVDGVNGSGKTQLAEFLSLHYNLPIFHPGPKPKSNAIAFNDCCEQYAKTNVIFDRLTCVTRVVYGDDNENPKGLGKYHIEDMDYFVNMMILKRTIFIHTVGRGDAITKPYYTDFHAKEIVKIHEELRRRYLERFKKIPHFEYDFNVHSTDEVLEYVKVCREKPGCFSKAL